MPHLASLLLAILLTGYFLPHITDAAPASAAPPRFPSADAGQRRCSVDTVKNFYTILFGFAGVMHFIRPATFDALVPEQLPGRQRTWTYGSGVCELVAAALLSNRRTRSFGGLFSAALLLGVWPGNIYMARNSPTLAFGQGCSCCTSSTTNPVDSRRMENLPRITTPVT